MELFPLDNKLKSSLEKPKSTNQALLGPHYPLTAKEGQDNLQQETKWKKFSPIQNMALFSYFQDKDKTYKHKKFELSSTNSQ